MGMQKNTDNVISSAIGRYLRISPFKVRRIAQLVKGKPVEAALVVLGKLQEHHSARVLFKVIASAAANARHNQKFQGDLIVNKVQVDQALIMKRFQARSKGRAFPIKKRLSHVMVCLGEKV